MTKEYALRLACAILEDELQYTDDEGADEEYYHDIQEAIEIIKEMVRDV